MADVADMNRDTLDPDYIQLFDVHVGPVETLVEEVLAHESVSDKVALKQKQEASDFVENTFGSPDRLVGLCPGRILLVCKRIHIGSRYNHIRCDR